MRTQTLEEREREHERVRLRACTCAVASRELAASGAECIGDKHQLRGGACRRAQPQAIPSLRHAWWVRDGPLQLLSVRFAPSVSEALGGGGRHLCRGAGLTCSLEDSAAGMVLQMQRWPGAQRVERMLMGKSEGRRRKYIVSVLERSEDGAPNLEVPRSFLRRRSGSMHRLTEVTCAACGVYRSCDTLGAKAAFSALTSANRWRLHRMCLACVQVAACTSTRTRASRICQCSGATWCCRR